MKFSILQMFLGVSFVAMMIAASARAEDEALPPCPEQQPTSTWDACAGAENSKDYYYSGEYHNGRPEGRGHYVFPDGITYSGQIKNKLPHGKGTETNPAGEKYTGEWKFGHREGKGSQTYKDGQKYIGMWSNGKRNGQGTITFRDGTKYTGLWADDARNGMGTETHVNGEKYVGEWKDGIKNGKGSGTFANGTAYVGYFEAGEQVGKGTAVFPDGSSYEGEYAHGYPNGKGREKRFSGEIYEGEYKDGKWDGYGIYYGPDGSVISKGYFSEGKFIGGTKASVSQLEVQMVKEGGVYVVPIRFNGVLTLNGIVDSGAADVSIPSDIVSTLIRTKTITDKDFLGTQTYVLADGSKVPSARFNIQSLQIGDKIVKNVTASVASQKAEILLGQSFLEKFKSWSVDNEKHLLILKEQKVPD